MSAAEKIQCVVWFILLYYDPTLTLVWPFPLSQNLLDLKLTLVTSIPLRNVKMIQS